jgi:hypothetical protein
VRPSDTAGRGEAWEWVLDGGAKKLDAAIDGVVQYPVLSPDGRSVVYRVPDTRPARPLEVISLENFLPAATAKSTRR